MTLIVSLKTPDGIVIAGDSMSTMRSQMKLEVNAPLKCPECGKENKIKMEVGGIPMTATTLPYAQKVFPFMDNFGVGTFGSGQLSGKTMHFAIRELERELKN